MRIGLMVELKDPGISFSEYLQRTSESGFEVIQLWYKDIEAHVGEDPQKLQTQLKGLGLELKSLGAYTDIIDPGVPRDTVIDYFKKVIDFASAANVPFVATESGGHPGKLEGWNEMISRFIELADYAGSRSVIVLVENGPGVLVGTTELMTRMMEEIDSDNIGINFDPANLVLMSGDVVKAVEVLGSKIMDTHAKDSILLTGESDRAVPEEHIFVLPEGEDFIHLPDGVTWVLPPVGEGDVPFEEYIAALKKTGFKGDLIIEYQGGGDREEAIMKSKKYLEGIIS